MTENWQKNMDFQIREKSVKPNQNKYGESHGYGNIVKCWKPNVDRLSWKLTEKNGRGGNNYSSYHWLFIGNNEIGGQWNNMSQVQKKHSTQNSVSNENVTQEWKQNMYSLSLSLSIAQIIK